jgi:hypothetical protein
VQNDRLNKADRFLRKMVRVLVACAVRAVAEGEGVGALVELARGGDREKVPLPAPPHGLMMAGVQFWDPEDGSDPRPPPELAEACRGVGAGVATGGTGGSGGDGGAGGSVSGAGAPENLRKFVVRLAPVPAGTGVAVRLESAIEGALACASAGGAGAGSADGDGGGGGGAGFRVTVAPNMGAAFVTFVAEADMRAVLALDGRSSFGMAPSPPGESSGAANVRVEQLAEGRGKKKGRGAKRKHADIDIHKE